MTSSSLLRIQGAGVQRGFRNLLSIESRKWWGARRWWVNLLVWVGFINGFLQVNLFGQEKEISNVLMFFFLYLGTSSVGIIIISHGAVIGEKVSGTAEWILSKPVSRISYIFSKIIGNMIGSLVTMIVVPGIIGYFQICVSFDKWLSPLNFIQGLCMVVIFNLMFLTFTMMLGTVFNRRGPVLGISLGYFLFQNMVGRGTMSIAKYLPWALVFPNGNNEPAIAVLLVQGKKVTNVMPLFVAICITVFSVISATWVFRTKEL